MMVYIHVYICGVYIDVYIHVVYMYRASAPEPPLVAGGQAAPSRTRMEGNLTPPRPAPRRTPSSLPLVPAPRRSVAPPCTRTRAHATRRTLPYPPLLDEDAP
jgi:hypothetical protein